MSKFSIRLSDRVAPTKIKLYKLAINNICPVDEFEALIRQEGKLVSELRQIYSVIEDTCNLFSLPKTKFRHLKMGKWPYQLYEAKSKNLRYYLIKLEKTGRVILLGGRKGNQNTDLKYLEGLIKDIHSKGILNLNDL
jgi:hypothetical protein